MNKIFEKFSRENIEKEHIGRYRSNESKYIGYLLEKCKDILVFVVCTDHFVDLDYSNDGTLLGSKLLCFALRETRIRKKFIDTLRNLGYCAYEYRDKQVIHISTPYIEEHIALAAKDSVY